MKKFRPGVSFSDFLIQDSSTRPSRIKEKRSIAINIGTGIWLTALLAMAFLLVRLGSLQVLQGSHYRVLAEENRVKRINLPAPRGIIYDRTGVKLADNLKNPDESWARLYPLGRAGSAVLGYLGEVSPEEVGLLKSNGGKYDLGDSVGRGGLELEYEEQLRGANGGRLVEVNNLGESVRELGRQEPIAGQDLHTTIDSSLQRIASDALGSKKGGVVAANPKTGEIYVLASSPSFDPLDVGSAIYQADLPLLNRAIGGIYAPGSTFKMITTVAGMTDGNLGSDFTYTDVGAIHVGTFSYTNWFFTQHGGVEGTIGWSRALARSTDTFFYKVGELTGAANIAKWANQMGLGAKTGIDLPGEVSGLVPTPEWKLKALGERWYLGNTYHMAIGQDDILSTPLQINLMTNILASAGQKCPPHLLQNSNSKCSTVAIDKKILQVIQDGMIGACSPEGTAYPLFDFNGENLPAGGHVACKTGTAEYLKSDGKLGTHAWLTVYAPVEDPTISVTVLVEGGGEGSSAAAPIARKILVKYFGIEDHFNYNVVSGLGE